MHDREKALKSGQEGNMRREDPFLLAWDLAFKEVFGSDDPRAKPSGCKNCWNVFANIRGSQNDSRPNGWWTTELDALL